MRKTYIITGLVFFFIIAFVASASAASVEFSVKAEGIKTDTVSKDTQFENCTINPSTNASECVNQTITSEAETKESWDKSVLIEIECPDSCAYPMPSFKIPSDVEIDNYSVETSSDANVFFESTNAKTTQDPEDKIRVEVKKMEFSELVLEKILPSTITAGQSQINVFLTNNGTEAISYFNISLIGGGIDTVSAESSDKIEAGRMAIIPINIQVDGSGQKEIIVKVNWKSNKNVYSSIYSYKLNILPAEEKGKPVNSTEIIERFNSDREKLRAYEAQYQQKKSEGYLVSEVYDSIKGAKNYVATIQLLIEEGKFSDAKMNLALLELSLDDINNGIQSALKTKQTFTDKLKNNALLISSVIAAIVAIFGLYERQKIKMKALKDKMKEKLASRKENNEESKEKTSEKPKKASKKSGKKPKAKKPAEEKKDDEPSSDVPAQ
jgi:hypothetical protein